MADWADDEAIDLLARIARGRVHGGHEQRDILAAALREAEARGREEERAHIVKHLRKGSAAFGIFAPCRSYRSYAAETSKESSACPRMSHPLSHPSAD